MLKEPLRPQVPLFPIRLVEAARRHAGRSAAMDELAVADIDAGVRWAVGGRGEKDDVADFRGGNRCACIPHQGDGARDGDALLLEQVENEAAAVKSLFRRIAAPNVRDAEQFGRIGDEFDDVQLRRRGLSDQALVCFAVNNAGCGELGRLLETADGIGGGGSVVAGDVRPEVAELFELRLNALDVVAERAD